MVVICGLHIVFKELKKYVSVKFYAKCIDEFYKTGKWKDIDGIYHLGKLSSLPIYRSDRMILLESTNGSIAVLEITK